MKDDTLIVARGRDPEANFGVVNPPVYHASTIVYPTLARLEEITQGPPAWDQVRYGRMGTPTTFALEAAVSELEGGHGAVAVSSGLAAVTTALLACLKAGDHALIVDSAYGPTRKFCDEMLRRLGVAVEYYDPLIGGGIAGLMRENTRVVFAESPGSLTFEVQDVPAIAAAAHARGAVLLHDNTWGTPYFFKSFAHGIDVSIHAGTKYIVGHSDAMLGVIVTRDAESFDRVKRTAVMLGQCAGPDDVYLGLRGFRTLSARLKQHQESALVVARWLQERPDVAQVRHPALPGDPGHDLWRRDFGGASGLFSFVLAKPYPKAALAAMLDHMELFAMGYSWGGYESLVVPADPAKLRSATTWSAPGPLLRLHIGLEDPEDLIADLAAGLGRLEAAAAAA